jgi:transposase, IS5 family
MHPSERVAIVGMRIGSICKVNHGPQSVNQEQRAQSRRAKRSFRNGQKWRAGCGRRISVVKWQHRLNRYRYRREAGIQRWVGLCVIANNLVNIGRAP